MTFELVPLPCTILAIGPESKRGWSVHIGHKIVNFDSAKTPIDRMKAIECAQIASKKAKPLIVVMEQWDPGWQLDASLSGIAIGRWLEILELAGQSTDQIIFVHPSEWRKKISNYEVDNDEAVCTKVAQEFSIASNFDIAGSILIGKWAITSDDVQKALPRPEIRHSGGAWLPKLYESDR